MKRGAWLPGADDSLADDLRVCPTPGVKAGARVMFPTDLKQSLTEQPMKKLWCAWALMALMFQPWLALRLEAQPANDSFANRATITLAAPTVTGSNVGATKEPGEPTPAGKPGGKSVWWSWVAPASGLVRINTFGSSFDTLLGVYTGSFVNSLALVSDNDDYGGNNSLVSFLTAAGTEYQIEVDGYNAASGNIVLTVDVLPAILGPVAATGTVSVALSLPLRTTNNPTGFKALGLPAPLAIDPVSGLVSGIPTTPGAFSVSLIASNLFGYTTSNLNLTIDTAPVITSTNLVYGRIGDAFSFAPAAANNPTGWGYTGTLPPGLGLDPSTGMISGTPTSNSSYTVTLLATNASTYRSGLLTLDIRPINDDYATALPIAGDTRVAGSNYGATREPGETVFLGSDVASVWWSWTAPTNGTVQLDTIGSPFDTILGVLTNKPGVNSVANLGLLTSADQGAGDNTDASLLSFNALAGAQYYFCVNGFHPAEAGPITLRLVTVPVITNSLSITGTLGLAFSYWPIAINGPTGFGAAGLPGGLSITPATGLISGTPAAVGSFVVTLYLTNHFGFSVTNLNLTIDTAPVITSTNLVLGLVGAPFAFTPFALNVPTTWAASALPGGLGMDRLTGAISGTPTTNGVTAVTLYATNASAWRSAPLTIQIRPPNDDLATALPIVGTNHVTGSNPGATLEPGESVPKGSGTSSVWWSWTAPMTGAARVDTIGSSFDTVLGVFTNKAGVSSVANLGLISSDDDGGPNNTSLINFNAVAGATYFFWVSGFSGSTAGLIQLNVGMVPLITSPTSAFGNTGIPFTYAITAINSPGSFGAGGLPSGLAVDIATGLISGVPAAAGNYSVALFATNTAGFATTNLSLVVSNLPVVVSSLAVTGQVNVAFTYTLAAVNGPTRYSAGTLPPGLLFDPAAGTISGIPQVNGLFNIPVFATNASGWAGATLLMDIRPVNDDYTNAIDLGGVYQVAGSNLGATREPGEHPSIGTAGNSSVWWKWTATANGPVRLHTIGSSFDTILGVYTNNPGLLSVTNLTALAANDDGGSNSTSLLTFTAVAGVTYAFAVDGFSAGRQGAIVLTLDVLPRIISTNYASAFAGFPFSFQVLATNNPSGYGADGLPVGLACGPLNGLVSGITTTLGANHVTLYATNSFGTASAAFTLVVGVLPLPVITSSVSPLGQVAHPFSYLVTANNFPLGFNALGLPGGLTIDGASGLISGLPTTNGNALVTLVASNISGLVSNGVVFDIRPINDDFTNATTLPIVGTISASTAGATAEPGEPHHAGTIPSHSVWYTWSSPTNCALEVTTLGSLFDTVLAVYTGSALTNLSLIASNDDTGSSTNSLLIFNATANTPYSIAVDGYGGDQGPLVLRFYPMGTVNQINTAPILARIADRVVDPGTNLIFTVVATDNDTPANNLAYSLPPGAPDGASLDPASGIFSWRPSAAQAATTNVVTVEVTDDGIPPLSDSRHFRVIVNPLAPIVLTPITWFEGSYNPVTGPGGPEFVFQFTGNTGVVYSVLFSTNVSPASWSTLRTVPMLTNPMVLTNRFAYPPQGFYRLKAGL